MIFWVGIHILTSLANNEKKIHKSHAILIEKQVINHNVNSKNNIQNLGCPISSQCSCPSLSGI